MANIEIFNKKYFINLMTLPTSNYLTTSTVVLSLQTSNYLFNSKYVRTYCCNSNLGLGLNYTLSNRKSSNTDRKIYFQMDPR